MSFAPIKKRRLGERVAEAIRDAILGGEFLPGDPLPSERVLATRFEVNRSSIREALTRLEALGLVEIRHGGSTTVRDFLTTAGLQLLPFLIAPGGVPNLPLLGDLLELRKALMGWTARRATEKLGGEVPRELRSLVSKMEESLGSPRKLKVLDFDFFQALVRLTGNRVLILVMNAIRQVYLHEPKLFDALYTSDTFDIAYHKEVLEAMSAGDSERAGTMLERYASLAGRLTDAPEGDLAKQPGRIEPARPETMEMEQ
jgi:DNA-binding FadR family transcriptional regulator